MIAAATSRAPFRVVLLVVASATLPSCKDVAKQSEQNAFRTATSTAALAETDVQELVRGMPLGAGELTPLFANGADPQKDLGAVRAGLRHIRGDVPDLTRAKTTFFALTDAQGVAIRNDLEQDAMAGQNVWALFPNLAHTKDKGFVTSSGLFAGARAPGEPDRDWVAAVPIKDDHGQFAGTLLAGWTMRRFANHLQESLRTELKEQLQKAQDPGKLPIVYVAVFDRAGVFAAPQTPQVNEKALADLDLVSKTAAGPAHGVLTITERDFGYAAVRTPNLEPDSGVAVLWSEI